MAKQAPKKVVAKKPAPKAAPKPAAKKPIPAPKPTAKMIVKAKTPAPAAKAASLNAKTSATATKISAPAKKTASPKFVPPPPSRRQPEPRILPRIQPIPPAPPLAPVPTNGKPRKNQVGLTSKELEHFRDLLLAKRRELVGDMSSMEREALRTAGGSNLSNLPLHMADMGTDNYEQEFTLGLVEKDRVILREINSALAKVMDGSYGLCEGTGKPITKVRLEAQPWARFSIEYARQVERGFIR